LIGHITPTDYFEWCREQFMQVALGNADVIAAYFFGDRHTDEVRVLYNGTQSSATAFGVMYVNPSAVSFQNHNPTFRHYFYDTNTFQVLDHATYYTVLGNGTQSKLSWQLEYSAKQAYGLPDLSVLSWVEFRAGTAQQQSAAAAVLPVL